MTRDADVGSTILATTSASNAVGSSGPVGSSSTLPVYTRNAVSGTGVLGQPYWDQNPFSSTFSQLVQELSGFSSENLSDVRYSWYSCETDPNSQLLGLRVSSAGPAVPDDCDAIEGATTSRVELDLSMIGRWPVLAVSFGTQIWNGQIVQFAVEIPAGAPLLSSVFPSIEEFAGFGPRWSQNYSETGVGDSVVYLFGSYPSCIAPSPQWCMSFDYVWKKNGEEIPGATGSTTTAVTSYVLTPDDIGSSISLEYRIHRHNHLSTVGAVEFPGAVVTGQISQAPTPSLSGNQAFGGTLNAVLGNWDDGVARTYQWLRSGEPIEGATGTTYTLSLDDIGAVMSFQVEGSKNGYHSARRSVSTSAISLGTLTNSSPSGPIVTGVPRVGNRIQISAGASTNQQQTASYRWDEGTNLTIQWFKDGTPIAGATSTSYQITPGDLGSAISVTVTGSKPGYHTVTRSKVVTNSVGAGQLTSSTPVISGEPNVGEVLSAAPGSWTVGVLGLSQWFRDGQAIIGATGRSYTLTLDDLGSTISYTLTGSKDAYTTVTRSKTVTGLIGVPVGWTGVNRNGTTSSTQSQITAQHNEIDGVLFEYQWYVCESQTLTPSDSLPVGCSEAGFMMLPNREKSAFVLGYWGSTAVHAGKYLLVGLKSSYDGKSAWRYSPTTSRITDPPAMTGSLSVSRSVQPPEGSSLKRSNSGYYYWDLVNQESLQVDPSSAWAVVLSESDWQEYSEWRQEGYVDYRVTPPAAVGFPSPWVAGRTWYVCSQAPPGSTVLLQRGVEVYRSVPSDCVSRGSQNQFAPDISDVGKYVALAITYRNTYFSTIVFRGLSEQITLAPGIEAVAGAEKPGIVGAAEVGSTLEFQADYVGSSEITVEYQWFRCNYAAPSWSHNLPLSGIKIEDLARKRMELVPIENPEASWPDESFRPILVTPYPRCREISGATDSRYTVTDDDRQAHTNAGAWLTVFVTASNGYGSASFFAESTSRVEHAPYLEQRTSTGGSVIVPQLRCYTNSITNSFCRQYSGYAQGSTTTLKEFLPAVSGIGAVRSESWRFRGNPKPDLVQAWFICERDVPIYSVSIPEHCVEAPLTAGGISGSGGRYFTVSPEWWGSWIVSSYTATNRLGSLTQVASSVYLNGSPY